MSVDRNSQDLARTRRALQRLLAAGVLHEHVNDEEPAGLLNGVNVTFTLAHVPLAGSVSLYLNGVRGDGFDFTVAGKVITLTNWGVFPPVVNEELRASYLKQPT